MLISNRRDAESLPSGNESKKPFFFFFFFVKGTLAHLHVQEKGRMEHFPALRRGESVCRTLTGDTDASQHAVYTAHSNNTFINYVFILLC